MKKIYLTTATILTLAITSCNDKYDYDTTGNGAYMPATNNDPGNSTSDHLNSNNYNSGHRYKTTGGHKATVNSPDSLKKN